jgi:hypothetical protein
MKFICLGEKLRVCLECHGELALRYQQERNGGDGYYCRKCGILHIWNGKRLKKTKEIVPKCFLEN